MRLGVTVSLLLALTTAATACEDKTRSTPAPKVGVAAPPEVVVVGCAYVTRGRCEVTSGTTLTLWTGAAPGAAVTAQQGDGSLPVEEQSFPTGRQLRIAIPDAEGDTSLRLQFTNGARQTSWSMPLRHIALPDAWERATAKRAAGEIDAALAALDELPQQELWQTLGDGLRARIAMMRGEPERAMRMLHDTIRRHRAGGRSSEEARDVFALSYLLTQHHRLGEAELVLATSREALAAWGVSRAWEPYYRALLADARGNLLEALRDLSLALKMAERLGLTSHRDNVRLSLAKRLQWLGRDRAAAAHLEGLLASATEPGCRRGYALDDLGWSAVMRAEQRRDVTLDARVAEQFDEAIAIFSGPCPKAHHLRTARLNRALVALHRDELMLAGKLLDEVEAAPGKAAQEVIWSADLRGRLALAQDRPRRALVSFSEAERVARRALDHDGRWRALVGQGFALRALKQDDEAERAWREAEDVLDSAIASVPLGEGRASFLGGREASARALVEHLVGRGRVAQADEVARRARARALTSARRLGRIAALPTDIRAAYQEQMERYQQMRSTLSEALAQRWKLTATELPAHDAKIETLRRRVRATVAAAYETLDEPRWTGGRSREPGELRLTFFPGTKAGRWWCLASHDDGTSAFELASPRRLGPQRVARQLFEPLADRISAARTIRVLAYGPWQQVDLHALPFDEKPLIETVAVSYGVDLAPPPAREVARRAVIVADPREDLPHARSEGRRVGSALGSSWTATALAGRGASRQALQTRLGDAQLLHYAGHGQLHEHRLASELQLAAKDALRIGDILALPTVPPTVVLSGCSTAADSEQAPLADFSLAAAFVVVGAETVIATSRPVRDEAGAELAMLLYEGAEQTSWRPEQAFRRAQITLAQRHRSNDWSAYRLITR